MAGKSKVHKFVLAFLLSAVLLSISYICYILSVLLTPAGSVLLFLYIFWALFSKITQLAVFPGASFYFKLDIESRSCIILCEKALKHLQAIEDNIDSTSDPSYNSASYSTFLSSLRSIIQIKSNLEHLKSQNLLNRAQRSLLNYLVSLKTQVENFTEKNDRGVILETEDFSLEENRDKRQLLADLSSIRSFLLRFVCKKGLGYIGLFFSAKALGDLNYMRSCLINEKRAQQIWLEMEDGCKIDCLFIKSELETAPTLIYCNPNAGLYEFAYSQNEWISYYLDLGLNVLMWNYRGYGRSQGTPHLQRLQNDGFQIIAALKSQLNLRHIAIHGESLGGNIACHLAKRCSLNFLFADRTFSSLREASYFNFGRACYWLVRIFCKSDSDTVADFLGVKCYKVIAADANDEMIDDLASLKSGVALRFLYPNYSVLSLAYLDPKLMQACSHVLPSAELCNFIGALKKLYVFESNSEELTELLGKIEAIDAGGKSIFEVLNHKFSVVSGFLWVVVLGLWGSAGFGSDKVNSYMKAIEKIAEVVEEINILMGEEGPWREDAKVVREGFCKILRNLEEKCGIHGEIDEVASIYRQVDFAIVGKLIPISCGHCGGFSYLERAAYSKHFQVFLDSIVE